MATPLAEVGVPAATGRPRYLEVADDLRKKIAMGTYPVGSNLPSTARLMQLYEASVTVVRAAVRELRTEGLVIGQPGKGVFVRDEPAPEVPSDEYLEITDHLKAMRDVLDDFEARLARVEESAGLRRPKGARPSGQAGRGGRRA